MTGQSFVQIAADSTGKKLDTFIVLGSAGSEVHREVFILGFPDSLIGSVTATSFGGFTALHISPIISAGVSATIVGQPIQTLNLTSVGTIQVIPIVSAGVFAQQAGTWTVQQGGAPWSVTFPSAQQVTFTNSVGTHPVTIDGQPISVSQSGTWNINTLTAITSSVGVSATVVGQPVSVSQGTTPWTVSVGEVLNAPVAFPDGKDTGLSFTQIGAARVYPLSSSGRTLEFTSINVNTSALSAIVAADTNNKIKMVNYVVVADRRIGIQWRSGTTNLSGVMFVASSGGISANAGYPAHLMETAVNAALNIQLLNESGVATAASAAGHISFYREP